MRPPRSVTRPLQSLFPFAHSAAAPLTAASARVRLMAFGVLLMAALALSSTASARDQDIMVRAVKTGPVLVIDIEMSVKATAATVWEVMTDWDDMEDFVPSIQASEIVSRVGNRSRVRQKARVFLGPFPVSFEAVRDIELFPQELMRFKGVSGSFERLDGEVKIIPAGDMTRVVYRAESVPTVWVPPFVGAAMVEHASRVQFGEMREEIRRRAAAKAGGAAGITGAGAAASPQ
jgi:carbon monoxide dehydrogenase subunit G